MSSKNSYVPPSMRRTAHTSVASVAPATVSVSTKKKELKKVFALATELFPSLGETMSKNANHLLSFSSIAAKKIEQPKKEKAEVAPGWVHIRKNKGKIEYKYGALLPLDYKAMERKETILGNLLFKYQMASQQYERDMDVVRLGDLSEYYEKPTLAELHEIDMQNEQVAEDEYYEESDKEEE